MATGNPISFRLSPEAIEALKWAEENLGLKRSAAVELALRELRSGRDKARKPSTKKSKKTA